MPIPDDHDRDRGERRTAGKRLGRHLLVINGFVGAICGYVAGGWVGAVVGAIALGLSVFLGMWFYFAFVFR